MAGVLFSVLFLLYSIFVFARMGVETSADGIVIRNHLRKYVIKWSAIQRFAFGKDIDDLTVRQMLASPALQSYVMLTDGTYRVLSGLQVTRVAKGAQRRKVRLILEELESQRNNALVRAQNKV